MPPSTDRSSRLESTAFYALLVTVVLAPLAFWPSQYLALEAVKTIVIALGTLVSAVCFLLLAFHEKKLRLPPKSIFWSGVIIAVSIVASAIGSGHFVKSFFGQGFELGSGSFLLLLLVASLVAYWVVSRRPERVIVLYAGVVGSFLVLGVVHALRFLAGPDFATIGVLNRVTSSLVGNWYGFGIYAMAVAVIAISAILFLPLSRRLRNGYWILTLISALFAYIINSPIVWPAAALVFLGLAVYVTIQRTGAAGAGASFVRYIAWVPLVALVISAIFVFKGPALAGPAIVKLNAAYSEISLPWQMTLDVAAGELKENPILGAGPNRFSQAFFAHKPLEINQTDAWGVEFNTGFGLIPTFAVTQGLLGAIGWIILLVLFVTLGIRSLRSLMRMTEQPYMRFAIVSSYAAAAFLWILSMIYVPPHALIYAAFVMTGIWLGASVAYGCLSAPVLGERPEPYASRKIPAMAIVLVVIAALWGIACIKNTAALAYFGKGVRELTALGDPVAADRHFRLALALNPIDIYWQGRAEASIAVARALVASVNAETSAVATQKIATDAAGTINQAMKHAESAIASDPTNYYNYLSAARVTEAATALRMADSYDAGLGAYTSAIRLNPGNPGLYVGLARFQAASVKLDEAIQTIGVGLQVKNNYLDAVFLLAQISAAKGNLQDAIAAAQFGISLNPQNPLLYFQLGLFQYTAGDYAGAVTTLTEAVRLQSDYANAQYFLGLAEARLGHMTNAVAQFEALAASNPDNAEIKLILSNLRAGKSPFAGASPPITSAPEKRPTPPIQEKQR